jgi:ferric-dicitrate binding protein FerR (iron transport regulator)
VQSVQEWIAADEANKRYFEQFKLIWDTSKQLAVQSTADENKAWERFQNRIKNTDPKVVPLKKKPFGWARIAASVILVAGLGFMAYLFLRDPAQELNIFADKSPLTDTLPDNSVVTLNKHSLITYKEEKGKDIRYVRLKGEAFFNVTPNKKKPFVISVNKLEVTVVGTSFNVKAGYDGVTEVVVETGIVRVSNAKRTIELRAGERATISDNDSIATKEEVTDKLYKYYRTKEFVCDNTPLWKLVEVLNQAYDANIIIANDKLKDLRMNSPFYNESLGQVLTVIQETFPGAITITRKGDEIILN